MGQQWVWIRSWLHSLNRKFRELSHYMMKCPQSFTRANAIYIQFSAKLDPKSPVNPSLLYAHTHTHTSARTHARTHTHTHTTTHTNTRKHTQTLVPTFSDMSAG